jgi:hypothetical protein
VKRTQAVGGVVEYEICLLLVSRDARLVHES